MQSADFIEDFYKIDSILNGVDGEAYIIVRDNTIIKVSQAFVEMTEYSMEELSNKNITEIFRILRIGPDINFENINKKISYFLFTKYLEVRFINIKVIKELDKLIYIIREKPNSRFKDNNYLLERFIADDKQGIGVFTASNFTLIKANQTYLNNFPQPYKTKEMLYGKSLKELIPNFNGSPFEKAFTYIVLNNQSEYYKEQKISISSENYRYWNYTLIPVVVDSKVEYIVAMVDEVTENVINREHIRKQSEIIEQRNKQLEAIFESLDDAIFIIDSNKNYFMTNKAAKEYYPDSKMNRPEDVYDTYKYYDFSGNEIPIENVTASKLFRGEIVVNEKITVSNSKTTRHISVNGRPIYDSNGNIKFVVMCSHDITQSFEDQRTIERQKELLESVIENVSDAMFVYSKDKSVILKNEATKKFLYDTENFKTLGDSLDTLKCFDIHGNKILAQDLPAYRSFRGEKVNNFMVTFQNPDKRLHCRISSNPIYDEYGNVNNVVVCIHDITDIIKQEKQIKEQKEQLEAILNNMEESILVFDKDDKYIIKNNVAIKLLETVVEDIGSSYRLKKLYHIDESEVSPEEMPAYYVKQGKSLKGKIVYFVANGKKEYIIINGAPITNSKGNFLYGIISILNITEFMQSQHNLELVQKQLLKAEREKNETLEKALEMKDEFLSLISHEFRTPINVISAAIQALNYIYGNELPDKVKGYIETIRRNTFRQLRLVNNLLDITRANSGRIKVNKKNIDIVFLTKAITESVYGYAAQKGVKVTLTSTFKKKIIGIDDEKYERIILNLISNAIKFTSEGNSILVTLRAVKGNICVEVKDDGIGIPPDKFDIIFDKFGQVDSSLSRQAEGTGIGLSLVKMLVKALGGSISVKSKMGKGSTFTVILPDEKAIEEQNETQISDFISNRLIEVINVEFSDIYL
jgi:PAS domain S-box-containing protein